MRKMLNDIGFPVRRRFLICAKVRPSASPRRVDRVQAHFLIQIEEDLNVLDR